MKGSLSEKVSPFFGYQCNAFQSYEKDDDAIAWTNEENDNKLILSYTSIQAFCNLNYYVYKIAYNMYIISFSN